MKITTVLFDLDGTLDSNQELAVADKNIDLLRIKTPNAQKLIGAIWTGTKAMVANTGAVTNEEVFWNAFAQVFGAGVREDLPLFEEYYRTDFQKAQSACGFHPGAAETIALVKDLGLRCALATNPLFPAVATESRIRWAGLERADFSLVTTYENSRFCKPNPDYYRAILEQLGVSPQECVMVGNDVSEDMVAESLGMQVFLLTDCLINKDGADISRYPQGSFPELMAFLKRIA